MKIISFSSFIAIFLISICFYNCDKKDIEKEDGIYSKLEGYIYNEYDQPLTDASIKVNNVSTTSGYSGYYSFEELTIGEHTVLVTKDNFISDSKIIEIIKDSIVSLNFTLLKGTDFVMLSDSIKELSEYGGSISIKVTSNTDWRVEYKSDWISISDTLGEGNSDLRIEYSENKTDEMRSDTVKIITGTILKKLIITQNFKLRIVETKGIIGNEELGIVDSFLVRFNKQIQSINIRSNSNSCLSTITINRSGDRKDFAFSYSCGDLGGSYSFNIDATDYDGIEHTMDIDISLFAYKHQFEGYITDYYLLNNSNEMYISTIHSNGGTIYHFSIEADSVLNTFDLTGIVGPYKISFNPADNKLYVIGAEPGIVTQSGVLDPLAFISTVPNIYKLNTSTGVVEDIIEIVPNELDHPQDPCIIPRDIGFTKSGMCIVMLKSNGSSALRWRFLDTSNNDSVYYYTGDVFSDYYEFYKVYENYDHSKLFLLKPYGSCLYGIYDDNTDSLSTILPSSITRSYDLIPNKNQDIIFVRQLYDQFIMNLQGEFGSISYLDSRHDGGADFDYTDETYQTIFVFEDQSFVGSPNKFRVLDYSTGSTILQCDAVDGLFKFTTTSDGKWGLAYSLKYPYESFLYLFDTKMLKREN